MNSQCVEQAGSPCSASERDASAASETCEPSNGEQDSKREAILTADSPPPHAINLANIPAGLTDLDRWVNWDFRRRGGNPKWTKVPQLPNGLPASIADPETWHDFDTVVAAATENSRGIGFVFTGDGIVGGDIDDCRDPATGQMQPWAVRLIELLNTYTEISPSSTGVKMFVRGRLPENFRKKHARPDGSGAVEIYGDGRYFTVTGQWLEGTPAEVHERTLELSRVYQIVSQWKQSKAEALPHRASPPSVLLTVDRATALAALDVLNPDMGYDDWLRTGMALHSSDTSEAMLAEWESWSRGSHKFVEGQCREKWESFGGGEVGVGTLCQMADETGKPWRPTIPAQASAADPTQQVKSALLKGLRALGNGHHPSQVIDSVACSMNSLSALQAKPALETLTSQELDQQEFPHRYLIPGILARGEPCILAGPKKSLKSSALIDLALSVSEAGQFLNEFDAATSIRVAVISGESGKATIQETARRIARSKGRKRFANYTNVFWCFDLPKLGTAGTVDALVGYIRKHKLELLILDPAYLCMPLGDSASNLFVVGNMLADLSKVMAQTGCTIILCHHTRKSSNDSFAPLELDSIAWSGFAEWARQWMLLSRRAPFDPDSSGHHELWLSAGGSAGHSGVWAVDIHEGRQSDSGGRKWRVIVTTATKSKAEKDRERNQKQTEQAEQIKESNRERLLDAYQQYPDGETVTTIRGTARLSGAKFNQINAELLEDGLVEPCVVVKGNKQHPGYRLTCSGTAGLSGTAEESPSCPSE